MKKFKRLLSAVLALALALGCMGDVSAAPATAAAGISFSMTGATAKNPNMACESPTVTVSCASGLRSVEVTTSVYKSVDGKTQYVTEKVEKFCEDDLSGKTSYEFTFDSEHTGSFTVTATDMSGKTGVYKIYVGHLMGGRGSKLFEATCEKNGYIYTAYKCANCGKDYYSYTTERKNLAALGHEYDTKPDWVVADPCEDINASIDEFVCRRCGKIEHEGTNGLEFDEEEHSWVDDPDSTRVLNADNACTKITVTYEKCEYCGVHRLKTVTEPVGHYPCSANAQRIERATCLKAEQHISYCTVCKKDLEATSYGAPAGHSYVPTYPDYQEKIDCLRGYEGPAKCSVCGETIDNYSIAPKTEHAYEVKVTKLPTCDEEGLEQKVCKICGHIDPDYSRELEKLSHVPAEDDGDCTTPILCTLCQAVLVEAKVHNYEGADYENDLTRHWQVCTNKGCSVTKVEAHTHGADYQGCGIGYHCGVCGSYARDSYHDYHVQAYEKDPSKGHVFVCSRCGKIDLTQGFGYDGLVGHSSSVTDCTKERKCDVCGYVIRDAQPEHKWGDPINVGNQSYHERDCTYFYVLSHCNERMSEPHDFSFSTYEEVIEDATCTTPGSHYEVKRCVCGYEVKTLVEDPAKGHSFGDYQISQESTCEANGLKYRECENCGEIEYEQVLSSGHQFDTTTYVTDKNPTCTEEGTQSYHCTVCGMIQPGSQITIQKLDHTPDTFEEPATCTNDGQTVTFCTVCKEVIGTEPIEKLPHQFEQQCLGNATCETPGMAVLVCTVCGYHDPTPEPCKEHTEPLGHEWVYHSDNNAGIEKDGTKTPICERCGAKGEPVPDVGSALEGHSFINYVRNNDATCTANGTETAICDVCGIATDTKEVPDSALGHVYTSSYIYDGNATCTEDGTESQYCERCLEKIDTKICVNSATGHLFTDYVSLNDATCTEDGHVYATCGNPGCNEEDIEIDVGSALGHAFTSYIYNDDAGCTDDGTETAACDHGCGATDIRTAAGTAGHIWGGFVFTWNDDLTAANVEYSCTRDSSHKKQHEAKVEVVTTEPDCENPGKVTAYAYYEVDGTTHADAKDVKTITALGHKWGEPVFSWDGGKASAKSTCANDPSHTLELEVTVSEKVETAPTCTKDGVSVLTAATELEGKSYTSTKEVVMPALGHKWNEPEFTWDGNKASAKTTCANDPTHTLDLKTTVTETTTAPTCTEEGTTALIATVELDGKTYTSAKALEKTPALGHKWGEPVFTWDGGKASAKSTCANDPSHTLELEVTVSEKVETAPTCTEDGVSVITATVELEGKTYTSTKTAAVSKLGHVFNGKDKCEVCGEPNPDYRETHRHIPNNVYFSDPTSHWSLCITCGARLIYAPHTFSDGVCTVCGYIDLSYVPEPEPDEETVEVETPVEGRMSRVRVEAVR